jgi:hypothetical protein
MKLGNCSAKNPGCANKYDGVFPFSVGFIRARVQARRSAREQRCRGIFADWKASGLAVCASCRTRNVTKASFYHWRRELAVRDRYVA